MVVVLLHRALKFWSALRVGNEWDSTTHGLKHENNVEFDVHMFKPELYSLAKSVRIPKQYVADDIIHMAIMCCDYHHTTVSSMRSKKFGHNEALCQVPDVQWQNYIKHAEALIEESWQRECGMDLTETAPVTMHLGSETDTDSEYDNIRFLFSTRYNKINFK
ncbi:hypothetical protein CBL_21145 [Carabus blaptoides fortunei]